MSIFLVPYLCRALSKFLSEDCIHIQLRKYRSILKWPGATTLMKQEWIGTSPKKNSPLKQMPGFND